MIPTDQAVAESHDYLDAFYSWFVLRARQSGFFFDFDYIIPDVLNGLRFNSLALGDLAIGPNLYLVLPPTAAHVANDILIRGCALAGMYLLLRDHLFERTAYFRWVAAVVAFSFAVLPHKPYLFGTGTYLPLLAWAALNIWNGDVRARNWIIAAVYPFYSFTFYGGLSVMGYLIAAAVWAIAIRRDRAARVATLAALVCGLFVISEIRMIYHWFFASYEHVSARGFELPESFQPGVYVESFLRHLVMGNDTLHFSFHYPVLSAVVAATAVGWGVLRFRNGAAVASSSTALPGIMTAMFALLVLNSVIKAEETHFKIVYFLTGLPLSLARSDVASPMLWWVLFAASLMAMAQYGPVLRRFIVPAVVVLVGLHSTLQFPGVKDGFKDQLGIPANVGLRAALAGGALGRFGEIRLGNTSLNEIAGLKVLLPDPEVPHPDQQFRGHGVYGFAEYYEAAAFDEIGPVLAERLGADRSAYRVLSIGIAPAVAMVNGYSTLGGYFADQPLDYLLRFNRVFAAEYEKSGKDPTPGNLAFAHVSPASVRDGVIDPDLDLCLLDELGGKVVISMFAFADPVRQGMEAIGTFSGLHVYARLPDPTCVGAAAAREAEGR